MVSNIQIAIASVSLIVQGFSFFSLHHEVMKRLFVCLNLEWDCRENNAEGDGQKSQTMRQVIKRREENLH